MMVLLAIWGLCLVALMVYIPISFAVEGDWVGAAIFVGLYVIVALAMACYRIVDDWRCRRWRASRYPKVNDDA